MAEPLTRGEAESDSPLAQSARRLERALQRLEESLVSPGPISDGGAALVVELDAARRRQRQLADAASGASEALGRAMAEVRRTLEEDAERQGLLDFADGLEAEPQPVEEDRVDAPPSEEEPAT